MPPSPESHTTTQSNYCTVRYKLTLRDFKDATAQNSTPHGCRRKNKNQPPKLTCGLPPIETLFLQPLPLNKMLDDCEACVKYTQPSGLPEHRKVRDRAAEGLVQKKARWIGTLRRALPSAHTHRQALGRPIAEGSKSSTEPYRCSAYSFEEEVDSQDSGNMKRLGMAHRAANYCIR